MDCYIIPGSANSTPQSVQWIESHNPLKRSFVVYGSANAVVILDATNKYAICTLKGHAGRVNAITTFFRTDSVTGGDIIVVISADDVGCINSWSCKDLLNCKDWTKVDMISGLASVMSLSSAVISSLSYAIAATDSNGKTVTWIVQGDVMEGPAITVDDFNLPRSQLCKALRIIPLHIPSNESFLLAIGSVDTKIHVRLISRDEDRGIYSASECGSLFGHEDWVISISSYTSPVTGIVTIVSGSQDCKMRIWLIRPSYSSKTSGTAIEPIGEDDGDFDVEAVEGEGQHNDGTESAVPEEDEKSSEARFHFKVASSSLSSSSLESHSFGVFLDAICVGHEDWVTSCNILPTAGAIDGEKFSIISTSMDRNIIIWGQDDSCGVWIPVTRMGDIGGTLGGSVGGNLLGFVWSTISPCTKAILSVGYGGSFHLWAHEAFGLEQKSAININRGRWEPIPFLTGHFSAVADITWGCTGDYIISVSKDQTCRVFCPVQGFWREVSRPQIHGYDLNCVAITPSTGVNCPATFAYPGQLFVACDEKVIRVLDAPRCVLYGVKKLCNIDLLGNEIPNLSRVDRAYIPELGLSNKAADLMSFQEQVEQAARNVSNLSWVAPPLEGQLSDHTLWPEINKLFGHTNDVVCLTISPNGRYVATACKARNAETSSVLVWDTTSCACVAKLSGHESTVSTLRFSFDNRLLASAGKDRSLCLHESLESETVVNDRFETIVVLKNAHKRIVWDCCWTGDSNLLLTGSRDGTCKLWKIQKEESHQIVILSIVSFSPFGGVSVTTVDTFFMPFEGNGFINWLCSIGSENGDVFVYALNVSDAKTVTFSELARADSCQSHTSSVQRIRWSYDKNKEFLRGSRSYSFASAGDDFSIRIFSLDFSPKNPILSSTPGL